VNRRSYFFDRIEFEGKTVLDAGCGDGAALPLILERKPLKIFAVDKEPSLLSEAKKKIPDTVSDIVSFFECNVLDMNFLDPGSVDIVIMNYWLARVREKTPFAADYLREIHRVLKPDGHLLILDDSPDDFYGYDMRFVTYLHASDAISAILGEELWRDNPLEWMERAVEEAGFEIVESVLHGEGCTESGAWLKENIGGQIEEAEKIRERKVSEMFVRLLSELDDEISPGETFHTGAEYSILARKYI
jgi:ubiquinone/menaquinone biosynthesis C-methylase UbiE